MTKKGKSDAMDFSDIERSIVDYFERAGAAVEYRECEWLLVHGEISLTSLAATIHQLSLREGK